jgi:hypothetical protein
VSYRLTGQFVRLTGLLTDAWTDPRIDLYLKGQIAAVVETANFVDPSDTIIAVTVDGGKLRLVLKPHEYEVLDTQNEEDRAEIAAFILTFKDT